MKLWEIEENVYLEEKHFELVVNKRNNSIFLQDEVTIKQNVQKLIQEIRKTEKNNWKDKLKALLLKRRLQKLYVKTDIMRTIYH